MDNYNKVIAAANNVNENDSNSVNEFYKSTAVFGGEIAIISVAAFGKLTYTAVGTIYRATGFQTIALKCGSCVSLALGEMHWFLRTLFVEGSSQFFKGILDVVEQVNQKGISIENFEKTVDNTGNVIHSELVKLNITL